jgi:hypothetical protein
MKIFTALFSFEGESTLHKCEAIFHEGAFWLVPAWMEEKPGEEAVPELLVGFPGIEHQITLDWPMADIILRNPIPREVFEGRAEPDKDSGLVVFSRLDDVPPDPRPKN